MKVFISQPMRGRTDEVIKAEREYVTNKITAYYKEHYPLESIEVIDSFFEDTPSDAKPLWFLGKSLELLSTADVAYFAKGWDEARGCTIEHDCAIKYGIPVVVEI